MQKRVRANGEGTICKRSDGLYCAACYSTMTGIRHYFYGKSRSIVKEKMEIFRDQERLHLDMDKSKIKTAVFCIEWLDLMKSRLRPHVHRDYVRYITTLSAALGHLPLQRISASHLQALYHTEEKRLSASTAIHLHRVVHKLLNDAVQMRILPFNPAETIILPRHHTKERTSLTPEQATLLLSASWNTCPLIAIALLTGMRQGELLGLQWDDIDSENKTLSISRTLRYIVGSGAIELPPKTITGKRILHITEHILQLFAIQRKKQQAQRLKSGNGWRSSDYVFTNAEGNPYRNEYVLKFLLYPLLQKNNLPLIHFHDLRHSAASLLLSQGATPKHVQAIMGHARVSTTMNIYAHAVEEKQTTLSRLDSLVIGF